MTTVVMAAPSQARPAPDDAFADVDFAVTPAAVLEADRVKRVARPVMFHALPPAWVLPVSGYHLTGTFGATSSLWSTTHTGLDFAAPTGTAIHSISDGVVVEAGWAGAYGNRTIVQLSDGTEIWYCHQDSLQVDVGQQLGTGDVLGYVGATGNVTGSHLHLEVRPTADVPVDPYAALTEHGLHP